MTMLPRTLHLARRPPPLVLFKYGPQFRVSARAALSGMWHIVNPHGKLQAPFVAQGVIAAILKQTGHRVSHDVTGELCMGRKLQPENLCYSVIAPAFLAQIRH